MPIFPQPLCLSKQTTQRRTRSSRKWEQATNGWLLAPLEPRRGITVRPSSDKLGRPPHARSIRSCFFAGTCGKAEISKMRTPSSTGGTIDHYVKPLLLGVFSLLVQVKDTTCKYLTPEEYEVEQQNNRDAVSIGQYYRQSRSNGRCLRLIYALIQILSYY